MAKKGDVIENPVSGEKIIFLETSKDTGGKYLRFEYYLDADGITEPLHFHPYVEKKLKVVRGALAIQIDDKIRTLRPGDYVVIPAGVRHSGWNAEHEEVLLDIKFTPPMDFEDWFTICFDLAKQGKVNKSGMPRLFQLAVLSYDMKDLSYFPNFVWAQKIFINIVGVLAKLTGKMFCK